jgi:hypothetical protein
MKRRRSLEPSIGELMDRYEAETGRELETGKLLNPPPVSQEEFDALKEEFFILERTVYGIQQMLGKAAEYKGKPRGRLPR